MTVPPTGQAKIYVVMHILTLGSNSTDPFALTTLMYEEQLHLSPLTYH